MSSISSIQKERIDTLGGNENNLVICNICKNKIGINDFYIFPCLHAFHNYCASMKTHEKCPTCKKYISMNEYRVQRSDEESANNLRWARVHDDSFIEFIEDIRNPNQIQAKIEHTIPKIMKLGVLLIVVYLVYKW